MGSNEKGQLGIGSSSVKTLASPELVEALSMYKAQKVCCSRNTTFALVESSSINNQATQVLFSWGSNKEGVLGIG